MNERDKNHSRRDQHMRGCAGLDGDVSPLEPWVHRQAVKITRSIKRADANEDMLPSC